MALDYHEHSVTLRDVVGVEDAESLVAWLQEHAEAGVNLAACTHLHAAVMQVLMVARPVVTAWPANDGLASWLLKALPAS